ncbi:hypothetical protein RRU01S_19_00590 [Agrobacterium rubi TR3 = NBRC 13261]|uniref:CdiI immunity protein domain-containing protein n=1 Tax=Agrobacterium rubi TR3 = NBRC 13261 TaxID=1368415 RepID=A0A081CYA8_9HYPH|nr:contact-dependent growth inhibition system immunity protein [Agrobacterium rubi]MBP1879878.1 hypothetical protein [Agrobacterium rubi]MCL6654040.1 hypothetical protein [Agrobacterium rubi]GAK71654.1 hypothetical protein RRU01S_19_00590 [Agrobacterium rubi TR3 = NBRC 13261]
MSTIGRHLRGIKSVTIIGELRRMMLKFWWGVDSAGVNIIDRDFPALFNLIGNYLHQDMDIEFDSVPEALAGYSRMTEPGEKHKLVDEMETFLGRYHNDLDGEFSRRYGFDFTPDIIGQTVPEFFDMLRTILDDPESYIRFEPNDQ